MYDIRRESTRSGDCDDADQAVNPAACDILADGIDQDCDGSDRTVGLPCTAGGGEGFPWSMFLPVLCLQH